MKSFGTNVTQCSFQSNTSDLKLLHGCLNSGARGLKMSNTTTHGGPKSLDPVLNTETHLINSVRMFISGGGEGCKILALSCKGGRHHPHLVSDVFQLVISSSGAIGTAGLQRRCSPLLVVATIVSISASVSPMVPNK